MASYEEVGEDSPPYPDPLESLPYWGHGPGEDITSLPEGWEARVTPEGRVFFINHNERETQWLNPTTNMKYRVQSYLSYGWQQFKDDDDVLVYVDHIEGVCTKVDPRLLNKRAFNFPEEYGIRSFNPLQHRLKPYASADDVLKDVSLQGKVAIVTGANSGLGYETARSLAAHGAHVILACRDRGKGTKAAHLIQQYHPGVKVEHRDLDLASLRSVKLFSEFFIASGLSLDILVCNAGLLEPNFTLTEDGLESHFAVNYLGHFFLLALLKDVLLKSRLSRVVMVTSESHWYPSPKSSKLELQYLKNPNRENYNYFAAYGASKLCCLLLTLEMHRRYPMIGTNAVHPGNFLPTDLMRNTNCMYKLLKVLARPLTSSVPQGASSVVFCGAHPIMEGIGGLYIYRCSVAEPSGEAQSPGTAAALWDLSMQIIRNKMAKWGTDYE